MFPAGWQWTECGDISVISEGGLLATVENLSPHSCLVTCDLPMTDGRHYWEVELAQEGNRSFYIGAVPPGLNYNYHHMHDAGVYYLETCGGVLWGSGKSNRNNHGHGILAKGDRIGCLLDLDAGWLRYYRNGHRFGPGFTSGVTGPLLRAVELSAKGTAVKIVADAMVPDGVDDEPYWDSGDDALSERDY